MPEIHYDAAQQWVLNLTLAMMVLGLALDIRPKDFLAVFKSPKAPAIGLLAQFLLLPAFTCLLTLLLDLPAGIELGMIRISSPTYPVVILPCLFPLLLFPAPLPW